MTTLTHPCPSHAALRLCPPGCCHVCDRLRDRLVPVTVAEAKANNWFFAIYFINDDLALCWLLPRQPLPAQVDAPLYMARAAVECGTPKHGAVQATIAGLEAAG